MPAVIGPSGGTGSVGATQAFLNGAAEVSIMPQTRHKSLNTLRKYIRDRSLFRDNPAAKLGLICLLSGR
jgi:hypothetical protein